MRCTLLAAAVLLACQARAAAQAEFPQNDETLVYSVNWPSGLSLGEAQFQAKKVKAADGVQDRWDLRLTLDASVPGFSVADRYRSLATAEFCSLEFEKDTTRSQRVSGELVTFNQQAATATRETKRGGGKSEMQVPPCAKDALAFLFFVRRELMQGRLPPAQTIFMGGPYQIRLEYGGRQELRVGAEQVKTDRITASVKGKASDITFEIFLSQDPARRLVLARVPLPFGVFSMELVP